MASEEEAEADSRLAVVICWVSFSRHVSYELRLAFEQSSQSHLHSIRNVAVIALYVFAESERPPVVRRSMPFASGAFGG